MKSRGSTTSASASPHLRRETIPLVLSASWEAGAACGSSVLVFPLPDKIGCRAALVPELDGHQFPWLHLVQMPLEDYPRNEDRREQIGRQANGQGGRKSPHRTAAEQEQNGRRDDGGDVGRADGDPGVGKALVHGRGRRLAGAHLFPNALEDSHVRV